MSRFKLAVGAVALAVLISLGLTTSSSAQSESDPFACVVALVSGDSSLAPPPSCVDRSGADQDEFTPAEAMVNGKDVIYRSSGGETYYGGVTYSSGESASVTVKVLYYSTVGFGGYVEGAAYELGFSLSVSGAEARNRIVAQVVPNSCQKSSGQTRVSSTFFNPGDVTGRYVPRVDVWFLRVPDLSGQGTPVTAKRVPDGDQQSMGIAVLLPGTYRAQAIFENGDVLNIANVVTIPRCGQALPPDTGNTPTTPQKLRGSVKFVNNHGKVRVVMKKSPRISKAAFKVVVKPAKKTVKPKVRQYVLKGGKNSKTVYRILRNEFDRLTLLVKVKGKHGKLYWRKIDGAMRR